MNGYVDKLIKSSLETNDNMKKIIESLKEILKESPIKYRKHGEGFLITIVEDIDERNKLIEELKMSKSQNDFNRLLELMYKLKSIDEIDNMSYRLFFSMYINSISIGKFIE